MGDFPVFSHKKNNLPFETIISKFCINLSKKYGKAKENGKYTSH